ncbi:hypothetical protein PIROE2DRAFT_7161, partial [Piromyces sp. E2]
LLCPINNGVDAHSTYGHIDKLGPAFSSVHDDIPSWRATRQCAMQNPKGENTPTTNQKEISMRYFVTEGSCKLFFLQRCAGVHILCIRFQDYNQSLITITVQRITGLGCSVEVASNR